MEICLSSGSIWFKVAVLSMFMYSIVNLLRSLCRLLRSLRFALLNKPTKNPLLKPTLDVSVADNSRPLLADDDNNQTYHDALVAEDSLVNTIHNEFGVPSIRVFTYESLEDATNNFSVVTRMFRDGLGDVYIGQLVDTSEIVVIRRLHPHTHPNLQVFVDEVLILSQANHPNLDKLIGYCADQQNRLLVYEYVPGISLEDRLHGNMPCLDWNTRMMIMLGVAKALEYLQNSMKPPLLHCFLEPSNVWLCEEFTPKLCASGVIRLYPSRYDEDIAYDLRRCFAYGAHDYHYTGKLTLQSDVHGFGVLFIEMITGKKGLFTSEDGSRHPLIIWAEPYLEEKRNLCEFIDKRLGETYDKEGLYEACKLIEACLDMEHSKRPRISDVIKTIECLIR